MNFKKTLLAAALIGVSVSAHAVPTVMSVTSASFDMGPYTGDGLSGPHFFGTGAGDITDQYNPAGWDTAVPQPSGVSAPGSIVSFRFAGTGPTDQMNTYTVGGTGFPVFTGSLINGASTFDISSFTANWSGLTFNQGNTAAALTLSGCGGSSCNYSMAWKSPAVGGPINGFTGSWVLGGTITAVPEASTYGMMVAGLALVGFVARRRTRRLPKRLQ